MEKAILNHYAWDYALERSGHERSFSIVKELQGSLSSLHLREEIRADTPRALGGLNTTASYSATPTLRLLLPPVAAADAPQVSRPACLALKQQRILYLSSSASVCRPSLASRFIDACGILSWALAATSYRLKFRLRQQPRPQGDARSHLVLPTFL